MHVSPNEADATDAEVIVQDLQMLELEQQFSENSADTGTLKPKAQP